MRDVVLARTVLYSRTNKRTVAHTYEQSRIQTIREHGPRETVFSLLRDELKCETLRRWKTALWIHESDSDKLYTRLTVRFFISHDPVP